MGVVGVMIPLAVKPDETRLIAVEKLCDLRQHEALVARIILGFRLECRAGGLLAAGRIVGAVPVHERVVEVELNVLRLARSGELSKDVPLERRIGDVVPVVDLCRPQRKAVVMARGNGDVPRPGALDHLHPFASIELRGTEPIHRLRIDRLVELARLKIPLALRVHCVEPPVDEHAETLLGELLPGLEVP